MSYSKTLLTMLRRLTMNIRYYRENLIIAERLYFHWFETR